MSTAKELRKHYILEAAKVTKSYNVDNPVRQLRIDRQKFFISNNYGVFVTEKIPSPFNLYAHQLIRVTAHRDFVGEMSTEEKKLYCLLMELSYEYWSKYMRVAKSRTQVIFVITNEQDVKLKDFLTDSMANKTPLGNQSVLKKHFDATFNNDKYTLSFVAASLTEKFIDDATSFIKSNRRLRRVDLGKDFYY